MFGECFNLIAIFKQFKHSGAARGKTLVGDLNSYPSPAMPHVTLEHVLQASGCDQANVAHRHDYSRTTLQTTSPATWLSGWMTTTWIMYAVYRTTPDTRQDRALASDPEELHPAGKLLSTG